VVPAEGGSPRQVTRGNFDHQGPLAWLPGADALLVTANRNDDWEYDMLDGEIHRVELATGKTTALTARDGIDADPALSPDGRHLAYVGFDDTRLASHDTRLYVLDLRSGASHVLTAGLDRAVG